MGGETPGCPRATPGSPTTTHPLGGKVGVTPAKEAHKIEEMAVVGEVKGRPCILVDDMIDTASTVAKGATALAQQGAGPIYAAATHPVLSGKAVQNLEEAPITEVVVTNTMPIPEEKRFGKLKVLSIAPLIADALRAVFEESSVSAIFHGENQ